MAAALPLTTRFWARGSYAWLTRRAMCDELACSRTGLARHHRLLGAFAFMWSSGNAVFGLISPALVATTLEYGYPPFGEAWWTFVLVVGGLVMPGIQCFNVIVPMLGVNMLLPRLLAARLRWLRRHLPTRAMAQSIYWEVDYVLDVVATEINWLAAPILAIAWCDVVLMSVYLLSDLRLNVMMVILVPACTGLLLAIVVFFCRVTDHAERFRQQFYLLFDSLPHDHHQHDHDKSGDSEQGGLGDGDGDGSSSGGRSDDGSQGDATGGSNGGGHGTGPGGAGAGVGSDEVVAMAIAKSSAHRLFAAYSRSGPGRPLSWGGFLAHTQQRPLGMRLLGVRVTYQGLARLSSIIIAAASLVVRAVFLKL